MNISKATFSILLLSVSAAGFSQQATNRKATGQQATGQQATEIRRYQVEKGHQGVAVDKTHFYEINNSTIIKRRKDTGKEVARWDGTEQGFKHLNSGTVIGGKLYCANSNFPEQPMAGSIEIFDTGTLQHTGSHSFGTGNGSVTWIDERDGYWWIGFAYYSGEHAVAGKDNRWTSVAKYSKDWVRLESWLFPEAIIEEFASMSNSGASWGADGYLYCTGHDKEELYVMALPESGYTLRHVKTIPVSIHGQAIAFDRSVKNRLVVYGLADRKENAVVVNEIK